MPTRGLKRRNQFVYNLAKQRGTRLVVTLGGGYPKDLEPASAPFHQVVQAHLDAYRQCVSAHAKLQLASTPR